jgi:hypothetical protein
MIVDLSCDIFTQRTLSRLVGLMGFKEDQWDLMTVLGVAKPWGFCDLALWLCGQFGSGWCGKECFSENFPTH